ncbi:MAG: O-antigen ligase family protein [Bacteroidia bacterium]|nr:O-antigen ligase family protein [Bacteroidia bacterium]
MMRLDRNNLHLNIRLIALSAIAIGLPFPILITNLAIWLLILNWLFESSLNEKFNALRTQPLALFFLAFFAWYALGLLYSDNLKQGSFELEKKLSFLVFPLILASAKTPISLREIRTIAKCFIISCLAATVICLVYAVQRNYQEGHDLSYVYNAVFNDIHLEGRYYYFNYWYFTNKLFASALGIHPVYLAMYLVFSSCLTVWLWLTSAARRHTATIVLFLLYNAIITVFLASRTQVLILFIVGLCFVFYFVYLRKKILVSILASVCFCLLAISIIWFNPILKERFIDSNKPGARFSENKYGEGGLSLRIYKWKYALNVISKNAVFGVGTGDAQDELQKEYLSQEFKIGYENNFNAHNQFLQTTLELGVFGLILFLFYLGLSVKQSYKKGLGIHIVFISLFFISCLTESMLEANKGIVFFTLFNSLFVFAGSSAGKSQI